MHDSIFCRVVLCSVLQLQRNILATCPRVTRFKIDWADMEMGEGSCENVAPPANTESESNHMMDSSEPVVNKPAFAGGVREDSVGGIPGTGSAAPVGLLSDSNQMMTD